MNLHRISALLAAPLFFLSGCATILSGTTQDITVITDPPGASCKIMCDNQLIGEILETPAVFSVERRKYPLVLVCQKKGYQPAQFINSSGTTRATLGNIVCGGFVGWAVDSATGSDNQYASTVTVRLVPCVNTQEK